MQKIKVLLQAEAAPGIILILTAVLAMVIANSPLAGQYFALIDSRQTINLTFLVNDLLMTIFFLDVGLEIKHQFLIGHLSKPRQISLPVIAAIGGVLVPALIFVAFNHSNPSALHGWAIPTATDIAFALGVIILLGKKLPLQLKVLLLAIAVIDDLIAIIIIAVFYTQQIEPQFLLFSAVIIVILGWMNYKNLKNIGAYLVVGAGLWFCVLNSGIHPTISGVIIALTIPLSIRKTIHKQLYIAVSFMILPLFALVNAGISLQNITLKEIIDPVPLGIALGLILGKQLGIFSFAWLAVKAKIAVLPTGISWRHIYGMAIICGIGFTMSVFIGNLAYDFSNYEYRLLTKLGVLSGSVISAISGYLFLQRVISRSSS